MKFIINTLFLLTFPAAFLDAESHAPQNHIGVVGIILTIENKPQLDITIESSGNVTRMYSGPLSHGKYYRFQGHFNDAVFRQLMSEVNSKMLTEQVKYDFPNKEGQVCDLKITFGKNNKDIIAWHHYRYGTESEGLPPSIQNLVSKAVKLTDPWLEKQLKQLEQ